MRAKTTLMFVRAIFSLVIIALLGISTVVWAASGILGVVINVTHTVNTFGTPFNGTVCNSSPWGFTSTIQAENYNCGGEGVAFHAITPNACAFTPVYRSGTDYDNITAEGTGNAIGCNQVGEWQATSVTVPSQGTQQFFMTMSAAGTGGSGSDNGVWEIDACDPSCVQLTTVTVPTSAFGTFATQNSATFTVSAGTHVIRRFCKSVAGNTTSGFCGDVDSMQGAVSVPPTIASVSVTPNTFTVPTGATPITIGTIATSCSAGNCAGATFAKATVSGNGCTAAQIADQTSFAVSGSNLNTAVNITTAGAKAVGIIVNLTNATNNGTCFPVPGLTGNTGTVSTPQAVTTVNNARPGAQWSLVKDWTWGQPQYANISSWLCPFGTNSGCEWYAYNSGNTSTVAPFSSVNQCHDSVLNETVLCFNWLGSYYNGSGACDFNGGSNFPINNISGDGQQGVDFPNNYYAETKVRVTAFPIVPSCNPSFAFWVWTSARSGGNDFSSVMEQDIFEYYGKSGPPAGSDGGNFIQHGNGGGGGEVWADLSSINNGVTQWHTFGQRVTTDGSSSVGCAYVDGVFQGCATNLFSTGQPNGSSQFTQRPYFIMNGGGSTNNLTTMWEYTRVWSCSSWQTSQCNGAVVSNP